MFLTINIVLSILLSILLYVLICLKNNQDNPFLRYIWIIFVAFIGFFIVITALSFIIVYIWSLFVKPGKKKRKPFVTFVFTHFNKYLMDLGRVIVHTSGLNLVPNEKCMIVFNHTSNFDPMAIAYYLRKLDIISISKPGNFKIPICGPFMRAVDYLAIDRENPRHAAITINQSIHYIEENKYSVCVAPEGTRNKTGKGLLPFHDGTFKIALKAKCPIVIITVENTCMIHKNFPLKNTHVNLDVLRVLSYDEIKDLTTHEISTIVYNEMATKLNLEEK